MPVSPALAANHHLLMLQLFLPVRDSHHKKHAAVSFFLPKTAFNFITP
jgi:hypothetical protein